MSTTTTSNNNNNSSSSSIPPPCQMLFRSKTAVELYTIQDNDDMTSGSSNTSNSSSVTSRPCITLAKGLSKLHSFSSDGSHVAIHLAGSGVVLVDLASLNSATTATNSNTNSGNVDVSEFSMALPNTRGVQFLSFSSQGTYLLTWEKLQKPTSSSTTTSTSTSNNNDNNNDNNTIPIPNLKIWHVNTGKYLYGFTIKNMKRAQWPPLKWTHDEELVFHMVTNEIQLYDGQEFEKDKVVVKDRIRCVGATYFTLPSFSTPPPPSNNNNTYNTNDTNNNNTKSYLLTTFIPEQKSKPAKISMLRYPQNLGQTDNPSSGPILVSKSIYQAEECTIQWSPRGDSILALTTTSVDTSGESYYGSTHLYLLLSSTKSNPLVGDVISVPFPQGGDGNGPVVSVAWMPTPSTKQQKTPQFAMISGRMPTITSLHSGYTGIPTHLLGSAHRNTLKFSPHGRFLCIGGFGNLAGSMSFYDVNKTKEMVQYHPITGVDLGTKGNVANCAVECGWAPNSRYYMVSTTSPRMNVDNGVTLYKYNGLELQRNKEAKVDSLISWDNAMYKPDLLLSAEFVPAKEGVYPDRPQSPPPTKRSGGETAGGGTGTGTGINVTNAQNIVIPSGISGGGGTSTPGKSGSAGGAAGGKVGAYVPPAGRYVPPSARKSGASSGSSGMTLADKMRREREGSNVGVTKVKPGSSGALAAAGGGGGGGGEGGKSKAQLKKERQKLAKQKAQAEQAAQAQAQELQEKARLETAAKDPVKRSKKLKKILKSIEELKGKDLNSLNEDQRLKLATEEDVRKELAELGV